MFLRDVEQQYRQLHLAYRTIDSELAGLRTAREIYEVVQGARRPGSGRGAGRLVEAREGVLQAEKRSPGGSTTCTPRRAQLRLLMGLSVNDGRFIAPRRRSRHRRDRPRLGLPLGEALARRPELRRQKLVVGSEELQAHRRREPRPAAARLRRQPAAQRVRRRPARFEAPPPARPEPWEAPTGGCSTEETSWSAGFEYSQVIGRRYALTQVRNHELRLAKSRRSSTQETEISHDARQHATVPFAEVAAAEKSVGGASNLQPSLRPLSPRRTPPGAQPQCRESRCSIRYRSTSMCRWIRGRGT